MEGHLTASYMNSTQPLAYRVSFRQISIDDDYYVTCVPVSVLLAGLSQNHLRDSSSGPSIQPARYMFQFSFLFKRTSCDARERGWCLLMCCLVQNREVDLICFFLSDPERR